MSNDKVAAVYHGLSAADLWHETWPDVPWTEASYEDQALFAAHAASLRYYNLTQNGE